MQIITGQNYNQIKLRQFMTKMAENQSQYFLTLSEQERFTVGIKKSKNGNLQEAKRYLSSISTTFIERSSSNIMQYAEFLTETHRYQDSIQWYKKLMSSSSEKCKQNILLELGNIYIKIKKFKQAQTCFQRLLRWNPQHKQCKRNIIDLKIRRKQYKGAETTLMLEIIRHRQDSWNYLTLGKVYIILGKYQTAVKNLNRGLKYCQDCQNQEELLRCLAQAESLIKCYQMKKNQQQDKEVQERLQGQQALRVKEEREEDKQKKEEKQEKQEKEQSTNHANNKNPQEIKPKQSRLGIIEESYIELITDLTNKKKKKNQDLQNLKNNQLCIVCMDKVANTMFLPCSHLCYCLACAHLLKGRCAYKCKNKSVRLVQVFL